MEILDTHHFTKDTFKILDKLDEMRRPGETIRDIAYEFGKIPRGLVDRHKEMNLSWNYINKNDEKNR